MLIWQKALSRLVFVKSMALQGKGEQEKGGSWGWHFLNHVFEKNQFDLPFILI